MAYTNAEWETYLKVQHELLLEDARNFVADYLEYHDEHELSDEEFESIDFEYLVNEYEHRQDFTIPFSDTWEAVVEDYMYDFFDEDEED